MPDPEMPTPDLPVPGGASLPIAMPLDPEIEIAALARRYVAANRGLIQLVVLAGGQVEGAASRLPPSLRMRLDQATRLTLHTAYRAALGSQGRRFAGARAHRAAAAALGALGGLGGLPTALIELPVTTAAILRSVQEIAAQHGEDIGAEETRLACLQVLASGGPLAEDDGTDFAFLGARMALTGPAVNRLIAQVAPRFAALLGQKLAAKSIPVIGAATGAGVNLAFAGYYQDMALVHFGLRRLTRRGITDAPFAFRNRVEALRPPARL